MQVIKWVQRYQALGFVIHPCCPNDHYCKSPGKIPYDPLEQQHMKGWQNHEQFSIERWQEWIDYDSRINIGFLCGSPSAMLCVDIDNASGDGLFRSNTKDFELKTWRFTTGIGTRFLYRHDKHVQSSRFSCGAASFEILGDGKQSVLPPSVHPSGKTYAWQAEFMPRTCEILPPPSFLLTTDEEINSELEDWTGQVAAETPEGNRNETLTRLAGHLRSPGALPPDEVLLWLRLYNEVRCDPKLDDKELQAIVKSIDRREQRQEVQKEREIREIMRETGKPRRDAELRWRAM